MDTLLKTLKLLHESNVDPIC
jgi:hypothetical protein